MTNEHKIYLKRIKKHKLLVIFSQISIIILFSLLWEYLASNRIINSFIYSSPSKIFNTTIELINKGSLWVHIFTTLKEIFIAFSIGIILGFIIAIILYEIPFIAKVLDPFLTMLNSLPKVALGPLIIILAGANTKSIIIMALLINLIISIMTIYNGFINTDSTKLKLMNSFKASKLQILYLLIIPNAYNTIIASLKINISMTLIGVIMGEFLVSKAGIGYLIIYGTQIFNMNLVMSGILILIIISWILYKVVTIIEKKLTKTI